jgi:hypothetical protein
LVGQFRVSKSMVFRLLARYRKDRRLSALLLHPRGRKCGSGGLREEQEQIITAHIRKIGGKKRSVAALNRKIAAACRKRRLPIPSDGTVLRRFQAYP